MNTWGAVLRPKENPKLPFSGRQSVGTFDCLDGSECENMHPPDGFCEATPFTVLKTEDVVNMWK